jgi:hypothetical protein
VSPAAVALLLALPASADPAYGVPRVPNVAIHGTAGLDGDVVR